MKKLIIVFIITALMLSLISCGKSNEVKTSANKEQNSSSDNSVKNDVQQDKDSEDSQVTSATPKDPQTTPKPLEDKNVEVLKQENIDIDGDKKTEKIEILKIKQDSEGSGENREYEGKLRITDDNGTEDLTFIKKQAGLAGVYSNIEYNDLDGDGVLDIFIEIPEVGSSFTMSYFFIYNPKTKSSYKFVEDNQYINLRNLADSFSFDYVGSGTLEIASSRFGYKGRLNISDGRQDTSEEMFLGYNRSWVEPVPIEMGADSRLMLVRTHEGKTEIKIPMCIFGLATADIIGEVDAYYTVDNSFKPVLKRLEIIDYGKDNKLNIIGNIKVN